MRAPLAPPRLSEPRKVEAEAQAVVTSWATVSPEARMLALRPAMSWSLTTGWFTAGIGSCHSSVSAGTSLPRQRARGPMSRWVSLYQARANASANSCGFSKNRREIAAYAGSTLRARSAVDMIGACRCAGSCASGTVLAAAASFGVHWKAPAGLLVSSHS